MSEIYSLRVTDPEYGELEIEYRIAPVQMTDLLAWDGDDNLIAVDGQTWAKMDRWCDDNAALLGQHAMMSMIAAMPGVTSVAL